MKSALTVVLLRLFTIGVFADGKEASIVSVMEGDSVTLKTGVTGVQTDDDIEWRFNGKRIDKFVDTLQLDSQTGDLKISNIRTKDSGLYKVQISSPTGSSEVEFNVEVVSADEKTSVSVNEGDSVTLHTDVPDIQRDDVIRWRFGQQKSLVAEINIMAGIFKIYDGPDERFRDRLTLNNQTGSLTITDINITDAGLYEAEISSTRSRYTIHHTQSFNVTVSDYVESVSVLEGHSVTLPTGLTEILIIKKILWKFGDQDIADLNGPVNKNWSNIHLNNQTGDLNISNIKSVQYGYYKVEIKTRRMVLHMKYHMYRTAVIVSVMVGDSVTLHTGLNIIQKKHSVSWFDAQDNRITSSTDINDGTRDLTIRNIQRDKSGDYKVNISSSSSTILYRKFHINITGVFSRENDGVKKVSVVNGNNFTLHNNATDIQNYVLIEWMFVSQNLSIAKTDGKSKNTTYSDDVIFKNKVYLDNKTGELSIQNSGTEHSGLYLLKIIYSRYTIQKSFRVTLSAFSSSGLPPDKTPGVVVFVLLVVAAAVAGVIYIWKKQQKRKNNIFDEEPPQNPTLLNGSGNGSGNETELVKL